MCQTNKIDVMLFSDWCQAFLQFHIVNLTYLIYVNTLFVFSSDCFFFKFLMQKTVMDGGGGGGNKSFIIFI